MQARRLFICWGGFMRAGLQVISALFLLIMFVMPVWGPEDLLWHNWQRICQVLLSLLSCFALMFLFREEVRRSGGRVLALAFSVIFVGVVSSSINGVGMWGMVEVAQYAMLFSLFLMARALRLQVGDVADNHLVHFVLFLCLAKVVQFFSAWLAAISGNAGLPNLWLLLDGFSNPRFYAQFLALAIPVVAYPLIFSRTRALSLFAFFVLCGLWMILLVTGARGAWMALGVTIFFSLAFGKFGWLWAGWQMAGVAFGGLGYWLVLVSLSGGGDGAVENSIVSRLTTSLSARDVLWSEAMQMIASHPFIGVGPMGFASELNFIGAHPHQSILQWACEWGVPVALLVGGYMLAVGVQIANMMRQRRTSVEGRDALRLCIAGGVLAALVYSMVDGVLVMPYSQTVFVVLAGWLWGLLPISERERPVGNPWLFALFACFFVASSALVYVALRDYPTLAGNESYFTQYYSPVLFPRFWAQGFLELE
ncbi:O-antigen ligase family protein [Pseudomonas sp. BN415]|uniref:O-antigen ligase family protein n=1 Tax=Pseudomonas sp. BN415 TaxID=2567889 RepID=UPI002455EE70|nr:O-antigen ligase family protein [Pseudomonas sp. BN415]MDH4583631.1 O-antigen ligase family protein [Pseudomonas sp. BN415]